MEKIVIDQAREMVPTSNMPEKASKMHSFTSSWEAFYHLSPSYHNLGLAKEVIQFFSITPYGKTQTNFLASPNII